MAASSASRASSATVRRSPCRSRSHRAAQRAWTQVLRLRILRESMAVLPMAPDDPVGRDKRHSDRQPVTLFVEYEGAAGLIGDFPENLSTGGTFVATKRELPIGTQVQLVL